MTTGLRALQQIRTLIPERLVDEEFSISVDQTAFALAIESLVSHPLREENIPAIRAFGQSHFYSSRWTVSGEPVRLLDDYLTFEYGPYWDYPTALHALDDLHHPSTKSYE